MTVETCRTLVLFDTVSHSLCHTCLPVYLVTSCLQLELFVLPLQVNCHWQIVRHGDDMVLGVEGLSAFWVIHQNRWTGWIMNTRNGSGTMTTEGSWFGMEGFPIVSHLFKDHHLLPQSQTNTPQKCTFSMNSFLWELQKLSFSLASFICKRLQTYVCTYLFIWRVKTSRLSAQESQYWMLICKRSQTQL